jgi:undecaprenyl-phosphate 4-deoxy-4-formamido-L-arabinose transferase
VNSPPEPERELRKTISIVVPCYRTGAGIEQLVAAVDEATASAPARELILVDDASPDDGATWREIERFAASHDFIQGVRLRRNTGQHAALLCGIRQAQHEVIVTLDDDLQNPPSSIPDLVKSLCDGDADVVYGVPRKKQHGVVQNLGSAFVRSALYRITGSTNAKHATSFRAFTAPVAEELKLFRGPFVSIDALLSWAAGRIHTVPVDHSDRQYGESGYTLLKLLNHAANMMVSFSIIPLHAAIWLGFVTFAISFFFLAYVTLGKLIGYIEVPGFAFTVGAISLFAGLQMATLGVIGIYVGRIYLRTMEKPQYSVASRVGARE